MVVAFSFHGEVIFRGKLGSYVILIDRWSKNRVFVPAYSHAPKKKKDPYYKDIISP